MSQIETAQTILDIANLRLKAEQERFNLGASVLRFVTKEEQTVLQADAQRTALEVAALGKVLPLLGRTVRTLTTNTTGGFVQRDLAPGTYVIRAVRPGFAPSPLRFVEITGGRYVNADVTIRAF